jgi:hypothetical protein
MIVAYTSRPAAGSRPDSERASGPAEMGRQRAPGRQKWAGSGPTGLMCPAAVDSAIASGNTAHYAGRARPRAHWQVTSSMQRIVIVFNMGGVPRCLGEYHFTAGL